jgi:hypothetical protein
VTHKQFPFGKESQLSLGAVNYPFFLILMPNQGRRDFTLSKDCKKNVSHPLQVIAKA